MTTEMGSHHSTDNDAINLDGGGSKALHVLVNGQDLHQDKYGASKDP